MNNKVNKEVCDILEHYLIESVPTIDKIQAKELAFKISSLKALRAIKSDEHNSAKDQLKRIISRILRSDGRKQRSNSTLSIISAEADENGSIVSDDSTTIAGLETLLDSPRDDVKVKSEEEAESNVTEEASGRTQEEAALPEAETTKPAAAAPAPAIINNYQAKVCRHHLLIDLVGETLYNDILCTTEEIRQLRRKSNFWTKYSVDCSSTELGRVRDGIFGEERVKVSSVLPRPIFDIYFRTPLLDAMRVVDAKSILPLEEQPEPCACVVQRVDWARLVDDARRKLERFRKFEKENSSSEDDLGIRWCSRCFHCHPEPPETF